MAQRHAGRTQGAWGEGAGGQGSGEDCEADRKRGTESGRAMSREVRQHTLGCSGESSKYGDSLREIMQIGERDLGWIEGIIDGEGCLGLYSSPLRPSKKNPKHTRRWLPLLTITNTNLAIINRAKRIIGYGSVHYRKPVHERDKPFYHYAIGANGLRYLLPQLSLTAKEKQRLLLLSALELVQSHDRFHGTPNDQHLSVLEQTSKVLNKRGSH